VEFFDYRTLQTVSNTQLSCGSYTNPDASLTHNESWQIYFCTLQPEKIIWSFAPLNMLHLIVRRIISKIGLKIVVSVKCDQIFNLLVKSILISKFLNHVLDKRQEKTTEKQLCRFLRYKF